MFVAPFNRAIPYSDIDNFYVEWIPGCNYKTMEAVSQLPSDYSPALHAKNILILITFFLQIQQRKAGYGSKVHGYSASPAFFAEFAKKKVMRIVLCSVSIFSFV